MRGSRSRSRSRGPPLNGPRVIFWTSAKSIPLRIITPRMLFINGEGVVYFSGEAIKKKACHVHLQVSKRLGKCDFSQNNARYSYLTPFPFQTVSGRLQTSKACVNKISTSLRSSVFAGKHYRHPCGVLARKGNNKYHKKRRRRAQRQRAKAPRTPCAKRISGSLCS